jgi:glyoxylase-like metal-dependent hydrolase (beta-lactamase superfamily II)
VLTARHTNPADRFETNLKTGGRIGTLQAYGAARKVITEGDQTLELRVVTGSPHADPMVIAYVPGARVLFQSDLFFPGTGGGATPAATHLLQTIRLLKLDVAILAGGHGGVGPIEELVRAVSGDSQLPSSPPPLASVRH